MVFPPKSFKDSTFSKNAILKNSMTEFLLPHQGSILENVHDTIKCFYGNELLHCTTDCCFLFLFFR